MRIRIRHETAYRYTEPIEYAAQLIRLTPSDHATQRTLRWRVYEVGRDNLPASDDGYGNIVHMLTLNRAHQATVVIAEGEVETGETHGVLSESVERLPPLYFRRDTAATRPDPALEELALGAPRPADSVEVLHDLMVRTHAAVRYEVGVTAAHTTAAEALAEGRGVCQDHAHILVTCARLLGYPARYVSGYLSAGQQEGPYEASHAWAEAHAGELGWIGLDAANGVSPTEAYVRVAIGLDYREAAPIRGIWRGQAEESLAVKVEVQQAHAQQ